MSSTLGALCIGKRLGFISVFVNIAQTVSIIRNFKLSWPAQFQTRVWNIFSGLFCKISAPECYYANNMTKSQFKLVLAFPLVAFLFLALGCGLYVFCNRHSFHRKENGSIAKVPKDNRKPISISNSLPFQTLKAYNFGLTMFYLTLVSYSLTLYNCSDVADNEYSEIFASIFWICLYVIGIPIYFVFLLYGSSTNNNDNNEYRIGFKILCQNVIHPRAIYKMEKQYFILVLLAFKFFLSLIHLFFAGRHLFQVLVSMFLLEIFCFLHSQIQPYQLSACNTLELLGHRFCEFALLVWFILNRNEVFAQVPLSIFIGFFITFVLGMISVLVVIPLYSHQRPQL